MKRNIDTKLPVRFFDDRGKCDEFAYLAKILFEDDLVCLCHGSLSVEETEDWIEYPYVLFDKSTGEVLSNNLEFWVAENYED